MTEKEQLSCIVEEIRAYPQPVAAGDRQFAALMERKAELEEAILSESDGGKDE